MRSLASLLETAVRRSANEVLLESGRPIVYTTPRGDEPERDALPATELFDLIVAAADDAQQVELAVGNPVEFTLDAGGKWSVFAEPGAEGITVRAWFEGSLPSIELELDPPVAELGPGEFPPDGFAHSFDDDDDDEFAFQPSGTPESEIDPPFDPRFEVAAPSASSSDGRPRSVSEGPPGELRVEALELPSLDDPDTTNFEPERMRKPDSPPAPFESGTWTLVGEDDFGDDEDEEDDEDDEIHVDIVESEGNPSHAYGSSSVPAPPIAGYEAHAAEIGVPIDDEDEDDTDNLDPFTSSIVKVSAPERPRAPLPPTLAGIGAAKPAAVEPKLPTPRQPRSHAPTRQDMPPAPGPQAPTRQDLGSLAPSAATASAGTQPELHPIHPDVITELTASISEGALVYVLESGLAHTLAQSFAVPCVTVDDEVEASEAWAALHGLQLGTIVIVQREDPSTLLAWLLRRLEEGHRVFVETRARTHEGARRMLLGVAASDRAQAWLDGHNSLVVEPGDAGPRVRRTN